MPDKSPAVIKSAVKAQFSVTRADLLDLLDDIERERLEAKAASRKKRKKSRERKRPRPYIQSKSMNNTSQRHLRRMSKMGLQSFRSHLAVTKREPSLFVRMPVVV